MILQLSTAQPYSSKFHKKNYFLKRLHHSVVHLQVLPINMHALADKNLRRNINIVSAFFLKVGFGLA